MKCSDRARAAIAVLSAFAGFALAADIDVRGVARAEQAVAQALNPASARTLKVGQPLAIRGLPLADRRVDLELERFDIATPDAVFMIDDRVVEQPAVVLLRGRVAGEENSRVVLGLGVHGTNGFIESNGKTYSVSTGKLNGAAPLEDAVRITDLQGFRFDPKAPSTCGLGAENLLRFAPTGLPEFPAAASDPDTRGVAPCRVARVAIDTDWEWTQEVFGGNAQASAEYALFLLAAISEVYERDLNVRLVAPFLRTFSGNNDPYNGTTSPDPLDQVLAHWNANMGHIQRETVHLLTGANTSYGGIAYVSALCYTDYAYGVSSYLDGSFPYPLVENSYGNWDLIVMAHELGHNFGTFHTHDGYEPPIDNCGIDCSGNLNGTIMSYCHICDGGLINIDLRFHPLVQDRIEEFLAFEAGCNLQPAAAALPDDAQTLQNTPVDIFVLANDSGPSCAPVGISTFQATSAQGGAVTLQGWTNPTGDPTGRFLRYTPANNFSGTDTFTYTNTNGQSAQVTVEVEGYRPADTVFNPQPGLTAAYYNIGGGATVVPDFTSMTPVQESISTTLNYASTNGAAVGGPLSDNVGAVFEGFVTVPQQGVYTFSLESDDGSLLFVGDELVVDNDGLHGMQTRGGTIGLEPGAHQIRVEFFEAGGGAGLIFRWAGPGVFTGVVPATALTHGDDNCNAADLALPFGTLDLADISAFIAAFVAQQPAADLAPPFGVFDLDDLSAFITAFVAGCP